MASFDIGVKENDIGFICKVSGPRKLISNLYCVRFLIC